MSFKKVKRIQIKAMQECCVRGGEEGELKTERDRDRETETETE